MNPTSNPPTALAQNPNLSVGDAAKAWINGGPVTDQETYLQNLQSVLGIDLKTQFADLTPKQQRQMEQVQEKQIDDAVARELPQIKLKRLR